MPTGVIWLWGEVRVSTQGRVGGMHAVFCSGSVVQCVCQLWFAGCRWWGDVCGRGDRFASRCSPGAQVFSEFAQFNPSQVFVLLRVYSAQPCSSCRRHRHVVPAPTFTEGLSYRRQQTPWRTLSTQSGKDLFPWDLVSIKWRDNNSQRLARRQGQLRAGKPRRDIRPLSERLTQPDRRDPTPL